MLIPKIRHVSREAGRRWLQRLVFISGGLLVGAAAVLIAKLADGAQYGFRQIFAISPYIPLILTPGGFWLARWASVRLVPGSQGSGIPQVIAARQSQDEGFRRSLVSMRIALGKIALVTLALFCGASSGREGPTVQIGASIMYAIGRFAPHRQPGFMLAGSAAGVAAAFNTPLAGIVFGIEEMSRAFETRTSGLIIGTVIAAGLTSLALVGNYAYFGFTAARLPLGSDWAAIFLCAVVGGLAGGLFSRLVILGTCGAPGRAGRWMKAHPALFAALCGLGVALCGLASDGAVFGAGYEQARAAIHGPHEAGWAFTPLKFLASAFSAMSGVPGGVFAPSLSIGAGLGADVAQLFPSASPGAIALIGMVSVLTGVVQAPITAFVIVSEMTGNHELIIPLMLAAIVADGASKLVMKGGLYHALAHEIGASAAKPS